MSKNRQNTKVNQQGQDVNDNNESVNITINANDLENDLENPTEGAPDEEKSEGEVVNVEIVGKKSPLDYSLRDWGHCFVSGVKKLVPIAIGVGAGFALCKVLDTRAGGGCADDSTSNDNMTNPTMLPGGDEGYSSSDATVDAVSEPALDFDF